MADFVDTEDGGSIGGISIDHPLDLHNSQATSSSSNSSGDTLHEDTSHNGRSNDDSAICLSSPLNPTNLDLNNLTIDDSDVRFFKGAAERYSSPFHRGVKPYHDSSPYGPPHRNLARRDSNSRAAASHNPRNGAASYRNSRTWMSRDQQTQQEFMVIRNAMRRLFKNSEVSKWKLSDYIAHREAMVASQANQLARQVKAKEEARTSAAIPQNIQHSLRKWGLEGNFDEYGNFGRVLGEQTIWCNDWMNGKDEIAPWPSMAEMKWEGDDRAKTGVGRFLPLPREEGPPTLQWSQLPCVDQYPLDQVARIPTMEDVYLPVDDQIEPDHEYLWSKYLEKEIDAFLES
ncbi:Nn.00g091710.m01.CDS01 [Neocucurbitaria sp. VM-36]